MTDEPGESRVVSLAPSVTATLETLGAAADLVGVTTHCDIDTTATNASDTAPEVVGGWLNPDLDRVVALDPDLVCTSDALQADLAADLRDRGLELFHHEPATLEDVLAGFEALGAAVERPETGRDLAAASRERLDAIGEEAPADTADRPLVYCEEWSDPPMVAGNWIPDAVRAAGGRYPFVESGQRSREIDGEEVAAADPDHVVLHVCGHGERVDPETVHEREWNIDAPVHVVDDSLLNQPSPKLLDGIERLAAILHAE